MKTELRSKEIASIAIEIAQKQHEILNYVFDFQNHTCKCYAKPRKRLFGRAPITEYDILLDALEVLKQKATRQSSDKNGIHWWNIAWQNVEEVLCLALDENRRSGNWRFESNIRTFDSEDRVQYVILSDEGAISLFSSNRIFQHEIVSPYSEQERTRRMEQYDNYVCKKNLYQFLLYANENAPVKSFLSDTVYNNICDYYISEGWMIDSALRTNYENKMYVNKYTECVETEAVYRANVKGLFAVGFYKLDSFGKLIGFKSLDYQLISIYPDELKTKLIERHIPGLSVLKLFEYLANNDQVKSVPLSLFSNLMDISERQEESDLLGVYSAILTLVANKLVL